MPLNPTSSAYREYGKSGSHCDAGYFGSPASTRCSHVTWFRSWLLKTQKTSVGLSFHLSQYRFTVMSSFIPFIWNAPSPTKAITGRSGYANFAATAYGVPGPIVARVPDSDAMLPFFIFSCRAHQFVDEPESAVTIASAGRRCESSQTTRWGFIGSPSIIA